jgi:PTS system mannose-specific IIB component
LLKIVRLDDRLVHGQLFNNWCTYEDITEILVVNEEINNNEIRKTFIKMSAPENISIIFCNVSKALEMYEEECKYENVIIVFGNPFEILEFIENGGKVKSINIGGMSYKKDKKRISTTLYVDEVELKALKKIASYNIELEIRILPTDKRIDFLKYC